ncbi:MAG: phage terminase large subunit family protein [Flavobacteriales bacterium]|nr:phage terminase large subunit family protein [Flavobacteriales bacterium]
MEWFIGKPRQFQSELQNAPEEAANGSKQWLKATEIATKLHHVGGEIVPLGCRNLVAHVDVHDDILYWTVIAYTPNGTGFIVDYNTYPDQDRRYFLKSQAKKTMRLAHPKIGLDGAVAAALELTLRTLLDRLFDTETSNQLDISLIGIDSGHNLKVCKRVVELLQKDRRYTNRLTLIKGFGVGPSDIPFAERKVKPGEILGNNWKQIPVPKGAAPQLHADTNSWKTTTNDRWATGLGETGSLSLYHAKDHQLFSEHQYSEHATETHGRGRQVFLFKLLPGRDNHWYDNVVACGVLASVLQCDTPASMMEDVRPVVPADKPKKKPKRAKFAPLKM